MHRGNVRTASLIRPALSAFVVALALACGSATPPPIPPTPTAIAPSGPEWTPPEPKPATPPPTATPEPVASVVPSASVSAAPSASAKPTKDKPKVVIPKTPAKPAAPKASK